VAHCAGSLVVVCSERRLGGECAAGHRHAEVSVCGGDVVRPWRAGARGLVRKRR
jgi:hypothetical protein